MKKGLEEATVAPSPLLLDCNAAAEVCQMTVKDFSNLVTLGYLIPVCPGRVGKGNSAKFSPQQILGVSIMRWCHTDSKRSIRVPYMRRIMARYAAMPWSALEEILNINKSAWKEESLSKFFQPVPRQPWELAPADDIPDEQVEGLKIAIHSMTLLRQVIIARLGLDPKTGTSRVSRPKGGRS